MRPNTARLARRIEARMTATVTITEPGPPGEWNDQTGTYDPSVPIVHYDGKAYVRPTRRAAEEAESVGQIMQLTTFDVMLPASVPSPDITIDGLLLTVTAAGDPDMVGLGLQILQAAIDDWHTARLLVCQRAV